MAQKFRNVGVRIEDYDMLREIADEEQRSMARQLSVMIRQDHARREDLKKEPDHDMAT